MRTPTTPSPRRHRRALVLAVVLGTVVAGCAGGDDADAGDGGVGLANPASVNCVELGGTLEIVDGPDGQVGWCTLPDGRRVEEWALWRETQEATAPTEPAPPAGVDGTDLAAVTAALDEAEARWAAAGITRYRMVQRPVCFCPPTEHTIVVEDGAIVEVGTVTEVEGITGLGPWTVEELHAALRTAIAEGAAEVRVTFDPVTGVPLEVWVDRERMMADEEWGVSVVEFTPLR